MEHTTVVRSGQCRPKATPFPLPDRPRNFAGPQSQPTAFIKALHDYLAGRRLQVGPDSLNQGTPSQTSQALPPSVRKNVQIRITLLATSKTRLYTEALCGSPFCRETLQWHRMLARRGHRPEKKAGVLVYSQPQNRSFNRTAVLSSVSNDKLETSSRY